MNLPVPVLHRHLGEAARGNCLGPAGIVDQDVDLSCVRNELFHKPLAVPAVADVCLINLGVGAVGLHLLSHGTGAGLIAVIIDADKGIAFPGKPFCNRCADSAGSPCD